MLQIIDHYLYFPKKTNAVQAALRLRSKKWTVELRRGGDGNKWLMLAKQPTSSDDDSEAIHDELERLARELGGEYDGWGAAVSTLRASHQGETRGLWHSVADLGRQKRQNVGLYTQLSQ